jgi:hypothetical protein
MPSNLPADINIGSVSACILRAARLNSDCSPSQGTNGGIVTAGLVTATATPDVREGDNFEAITACGASAGEISRRSTIRRYNLTGEIWYFDAEFHEMLFGGELILGEAGGPFAGDVIGWAAPSELNVNDHHGAYLEIITQTWAEGAGDCQVPGAETPAWFGNVFGKTLLTPGERSFANEMHRVTFTGTATKNPNLYDGPWNDFPGNGYLRNSAYQWFGYSQEQYEVIEAMVGAGYMDLPAAS